MSTFDIPFLLFNALILSSIPALVLTLLFCVVIILVVSNEEYAVGYWAAIVYTVVLALFTPANFFLVAWNNPATVLGFVLMYFAAGAVYSTIKYRAFVKEMTDLAKNTKESFIAEFGLPIAVTDEIPNNWSKDWTKFKYDHLSCHHRDLLSNGLDPSHNKARITHWIAFWVFSAVGLFLADPLRAITTAIYNRFTSIYTKIYKQLIGKSMHTTDY
jgi:energy-coupling factor transporter transmembrane protein EcfT